VIPRSTSTNVKKDKIAESAVMGSHVVALCGEVFPVTKAAKPGSPVCPDCKRIYEQLKKADQAGGSALRRRADQRLKPAPDSSAE